MLGIDLDAREKFSRVPKPGDMPRSHVSASRIGRLLKVESSEYGLYLYIFIFVCEARQMLKLSLPMAVIVGLVMVSCSMSEDKYVEHCKAVALLKYGWTDDMVFSNPTYEDLLVYSPDRHPDKIFVQFHLKLITGYAAEFTPGPEQHFNEGYYRCGYMKRTDRDWEPEDLKLFFFTKNAQMQSALANDFGPDHPLVPSEETKKYLKELSDQVRENILAAR
ncbi:MAG: hypothetical protein ACE5EM_10210 [Sphingomonadales bacterium]